MSKKRGGFPANRMGRRGGRGQRAGPQDDDKGSGGASAAAGIALQE